MSGYTPTIYDVQSAIGTCVFAPVDLEETPYQIEKICEDLRAALERGK